MTHGNLGANYGNLGDFSKAEAETRKALRLEPNGAFYANQGQNFFALGRLDEAKATIDEALSHKFDHPGLHWDIYMLAFLRGDMAEMQRELNLTSGTIGVEDLFL